MWRELVTKSYSVLVGRIINILFNYVNEMASKYIITVLELMLHHSSVEALFRCFLLHSFVVVLLLFCCYSPLFVCVKAASDR